ncbi:hypothetical protein [Pseudomonas sp.]|uniref:hypothetical protein n=1 Tax=Pseudomonas sp. TaxID=306 RepID=UPI002638E4C1|nr:hypothetical protein [Pseudomonas sp.]
MNQAGTRRVTRELQANILLPGLDRATVEKERFTVARELSRWPQATRCPLERPGLAAMAPAQAPMWPAESP